MLKFLQLVNRSRREFADFPLELVFQDLWPHVKYHTGSMGNKSAAHKQLPLRVNLLRYLNRISEI